MQIQPNASNPRSVPIQRTTAPDSEPPSVRMAQDTAPPAPHGLAGLLSAANERIRAIERFFTTHLGARALAPMHARPLKPGTLGDRIRLDSVSSPFVKDPGFANDGAPIGKDRYVAFGDLHHFYLKAFDVVPGSAQKPGALKFKSGEIPIDVQGLPGATNGLWAPNIVVKGEQVLLYYTAGSMPPEKGIDWPSFRLHMASIPLKEFVQQAESGKPVQFKDQGTLFDDQQTFGDSRDFAMIDPSYYVNPRGEAFLAYTVVKPSEGIRPWEEFVRYRRLSTDDPMKATGPDSPLVDGWAGGEHDGVAEAPDLVTIHGQAYAILSSRAGDKDQRLLYAPINPELGKLADDHLYPLLSPGESTWQSNAVGSSGTAVINGTPYMIYQGMSADHTFNLGWKDLDVGPNPKGR